MAEVDETTLSSSPAVGKRPRSKRDVASTHSEGSKDISKRSKSDEREKRVKNSKGSAFVDTPAKEGEKEEEEDEFMLIPDSEEQDGREERSSSSSMGSLDEVIVPKHSGALAHHSASKDSNNSTNARNSHRKDEKEKAKESSDKVKNRKDELLGGEKKKDRGANSSKEKTLAELNAVDSFTRESHLCPSVERDYSRGVEVQFQSNVPHELQSVIEADRFAATMSAINERFHEAERVSCASVTESLMGFLTCFVYNCFCPSNYERIVESIEDFIDAENEEYYHSRGVRILYPRKSGYLNLKLVVLKDMVVSL